MLNLKKLPNKSNNINGDDPVNKYLKVLTIMALLLFSTIILAGCGEEEKYNTAKNEFVKIEQEWEQIEPKNENVEQHTELAKKLDAKLTEMDPLAKTKTNLNTDLLDLKKQYKEKADVWNGQLNEKNTLEKMHKEVNAYGSAIDDPFSTYGKKAKK